MLLGSKSLLYFDNSKTLPSDSQPQFDYMNLLIQIYAKCNAPLSFSPHATTRFFSCSTWPAAWLPREPQLWPHANLSHSRCKCEAEYLCIAFTEELSCDILLCQCVVETKYQLQDIGEQIEHKVSQCVSSGFTATCHVGSSSERCRCQIKCSSANLWSKFCLHMCMWELPKCKTDKKRRRNHSTWKVFVLVSCV